MVLIFFGVTVLYGQIFRSSMKPVKVVTTASKVALTRAVLACTSTRRARGIDNGVGMATCGNKAKVRAFRERQRASTKG